MSYSKHTLLCLCGHNNPSANGLEFVLLFRLSKHRFMMPKLPKRRKGMRGGVQVCTLLRLQGIKPDFHPSEKQTIVPIRCQYVLITAKTDIRAIRKCYFEQIHPRLFTNSANQWFAKTIMDRSEHSENSFYTDLQ